MISPLMYTVPYGKTHIQFDLLPEMKGKVIHSHGLPALANALTAIDTALANFMQPGYANMTLPCYAGLACIDPAHMRKK